MAVLRFSYPAGLGNMCPGIAGAPGQSMSGAVAGALLASTCQPHLSPHAWPTRPQTVAQNPAPSRAAAQPDGVFMLMQRSSIEISSRITDSENGSITTKTSL